MNLYFEISEALQDGNAEVVKELVQKALNENYPSAQVLNEGLLAGMDIIGRQFRENEVYVPEVLIAARAMYAGMAVLKPYLAESGVKPIGKAILGTVEGDLHDIGKNLVKMMFESKGIEVIDLGVNVSAAQFYEAYEREKAQIVACSALLTTTMNEMKNVVNLFVEKGVRDKVAIMIGGAPITDRFRESISADSYAFDAATAADIAKQLVMEKTAS